MRLLNAHEGLSVLTTSTTKLDEKVLRDLKRRLLSYYLSLIGI